jgi:16S rRNA (cytosine967-C5)-methyltransferase
MTPLPGDGPLHRSAEAPVAAVDGAPPPAAQAGDRRPAGGITEARLVAADICRDLRADELLDVAIERRAQGLDARDRRWLRELIYGMLRRRAWLDALLSSRVRGGLARLDADLTDLLRLGAFQLLCMDSVPAYAAIAQTVELTKSRHGIGASRLANAVLRRLDRDQAASAVEGGAGLDVLTPTDPLNAMALQYSHPRWLVARWVARWGAEETATLLAANNRQAPVTVRPFGIVREQLEAMLESAGVEVDEAPLARDSIELRSIPSLIELGAYRQGLFFVQDPAATLVAQYASVAPGSTVVDLCAAPGGKALELSSVAGSVIAGDRSSIRLERLVANVHRVEARNVFPLVADAMISPFLAVDAVLLDAPCTGTGTFRRNPDARWRLKPSDPATLGAMQQSLLRAAATIVRPGGLLIYATCSLEMEENDAQVESFLAEHRDWTLEPPADGAVPITVLDAGRLRVLPQRHGVDGAFAARFRRVGGSGAPE